jgi:hypothetical protein
MSDPSNPSGYPPPGGEPPPSQPPHGQPPHGQPGFGEPPASPPDFGPPSYGQPSYGHSGYGQPYAGQSPYGAPPGWGGESYAAPDDPMISSDYAGWWRRSLAAIRGCWPWLVGLYGVLLVLTVALQAVLATRLAPVLNDIEAANETARRTGTPDPDLGRKLLSALGDLAGTVAVGAVVVGVVALVVELAVVHVVVEGATGGPIRLGSALGLAGRRFFPAIGWSLLAAPLVLVGACCLVVPGLYFGLLFSTLLVPVVVLERRNAIGRVFSLAHRDLGVALSRMGTIFGLAFLLAVLSWVVSTVIELAGGGRGHASFPVQLAAAVVAGLLTLCYQVLVGPMKVLAYADMRSRVEPVSARMLREAL